MAKAKAVAEETAQQAAPPPSAPKAKAEPVKRGNTFFKNPADLVIDESQNGRAFTYTDKDIYAKACSLKAYGQLQPIIVQRRDKKVHVVAGIGRALGAMYLNQNDDDYRGEGKEPFLVECIPQDDIDAFAINVAENFERKNLSPVDIAHIISVSDARVLAADANATDEAKNEAVAGLFFMPNNNDTRKWAERHRAIGTLSTTIRKKIHTKTLAVDAALEYVGLNPDTADAIQAQVEAEAPGKKATKTRVQAAKKKSEKAAAEKPDRPVSHAMNKPALVQFLSYQVEHNKQDSVKATCNALLGLLSGEVTEPEMVKVFKKTHIPNKE